MSNPNQQRNEQDLARGSTLPPPKDQTDKRDQENAKQVHNSKNNS